MLHTTHSARIVGPIQYLKNDGKTAAIPLGPCMIEQLNDHSFDIVWGARGQSSAALEFEAIRSAAEIGSLVLLD